MGRVLVSLLLFAAGLAAQDYVLHEWVVDGGGRVLSATGHRCGLSVGQPAASGLLSGTGYTAVLGFWNRPFRLIGISEKPGLVPPPAASGLSRPVPNPFSGATTVRYSLAAETEVTLRAFDHTGREAGVLVRGTQPAGEYRVTWDIGSVSRRKLPNGVYFLELTVGGRRELVKAVLAR